MGMVMLSIWNAYSIRVCEPEMWSEENIAKAKEFRIGNVEPPPIIGLELLAEYEQRGGEDESFREHVRQHVEKWNALGDDPYWNFDKRIHDWINKVFESKIPKK